MSRRVEPKRAIDLPSWLAYSYAPIFAYLTNTDTIVRIGPDGRSEDLVTGLPGQGDHQTNYPVLGPDGKLYWGQGSATNNGVVGADNFAYEWLPKFPETHDIPARDVTLIG